MQSNKVVESKPLIEFGYVEYKHQIEQTLSDIYIAKEIIPRHTVEEDKRLFGEAFHNPDISKDHMFGCQLFSKRPPPPSGREYDNANKWGKVTLRMVGILKTLQPEMFFDFKRTKGATSVKVFNPFTDNDDTRIGNQKATLPEEVPQRLIPLVPDDSITSSEPTTKPTINEVQKMRKAELQQLYAQLHDAPVEQKITVSKLKELIISKLPSNVPISNKPIDTSAGISSTSAHTMLITESKETDYKYAAQILSRNAFKIIQHSVDFLDITTILAKYNIDGDMFLSVNETTVHTYYKARMIHAAILNELLPTKMADVRQKFLSIQQLEKVTIDSPEKLTKIRSAINRIKTEIMLTGKEVEYPDDLWISQFLSCIECPADSNTMNAITMTTIRQDQENLTFDQYMQSVISYVEITAAHGRNKFYSPVAAGPVTTNATIQVAQGAVSSTNIKDKKCTFCTTLRKTKYPNLKRESISHKTTSCRRKGRQCDLCELIMDTPDKFHFPSDCPKHTETSDEEQTSFSTKRQKTSDEKKSTKRRIMEPSSTNSSKKARKVMIMQQTEDEWDSDTSADQVNESLSSVKLSKKHNYYTILNNNCKSSGLMIIDSGANQSIVTPTIADSNDFNIKSDKLHINGIGQMRLTANQSVAICDIDHYIVDMNEGIISISNLCSKFNIKAIFSKDDVTFTNDDQSTIYGKGYVKNGLYVIEFDMYTKLLQLLTAQEVARINTALVELRVTKKCEDYIKHLHSYMGHVSAQKMTNTIRSGIILPDPAKYDKKLHNTDVLCQMINRYYQKKICIACKIILHRQLQIQPNITIYPSIPFEEITFDYKPADILSYDNKKGTIIAGCMATMYAMQYPVTSIKQTIDAIAYFIQIANSFGHKIIRMRYDAATSNSTDPIMQYLNTRGIHGIRCAVGRQARNFVEKIVDKLMKTFNLIQATQCLLNITYWPRGIDTALSYNNMITNSRCVDKTPHEAVTGKKPRIQQYSYGQPVLINRQKKHYLKDVEYEHQNIQAIVIQIDNTNSHGVKVITCHTGTISHGYYDMMGTIDYDMYDPSQRKEIKQRFTIQSVSQSISTLPQEDNTFHFLQMIATINNHNQSSQHINSINPLNNNMESTDATDTVHEQQAPQVMQLEVLQDTNKITPYILIQRLDHTDVLQDAQYAQLHEHEKKPKWHQIRRLAHAQQWINVARDEIEKLDANNVGEVVLRAQIPATIPIIPTTLVLTYKQIIQDDGQWGYKPRARLAGRGDLEKHTTEEECYAPTTYISTILILLAIALQDDWIIATFDVIGAFLKTPTTEDIYISLPGDILSKTYVIKLHKYLYGLKKANSKFNQHFHDILINYGLQSTVSDICLYQNDDIRLAIFVDDGMLITRSTKVRDDLLDYLNTQIGIESHIEPKQYLKLEFIISPDKILIHQRNYIEQMMIAEPTYKNLHKFMRVKYNDKLPIPNSYEEMRLEYIHSDYCTSVEPRIVQEIVGTLIYVIYSTRGELQIIGHYLSKYQSSPTEYDWFMAYNTYLYLKAHPYEPLIYTKATAFNISLISDGAHMKNIDVSVRGQLGWFIVLGNCTVMIESKAAARPTRSATETEVQSGGNCLTQGNYILNMLKELKVHVSGVHYYTDCLSMIKLINRRQQLSKKARHFANELAQFKFAVHGTMQLQLFFTPTDLMSADLLTKLKILGVKKRLFASQILNPLLFFEAYQQQSTNMTKNVFKQVRFCNANETDMWEREIQYDNNSEYFNEVYTK